MRYRESPRTGWPLAEIGMGLWGMGGWSGADDDESLRALDEAVALGCNVFDTAWAYGDGRSERLLGQAIERHRGTRLYVATKIPPKNRHWPALASHPLDAVFPPDHIREYTEKSLENLRVDAIDLQQFHVWSDAWTGDERWLLAVEDLKHQGLIHSFGISVNRWEPTNVLKALATGIVDAVQVVYNIFDQDPEDELFPYCQARGIAIIARVPFDEGSLTGTLRAGSSWPAGDWRNLYFTPEHIAETLPHVAAVEALVPAGMTLPELALRFILEHPAVTTVIPGMRTVPHVRANLAASDGARLPEAVMTALREERWARTWQVP